ncbi:MAG: hypothetical protein ABSA75_13665 [Candidatus Bathyarchaeia archaeon]
MSEPLMRIVDRNTMYLHYDKVYTMRGKKPSLKTLIVLSDIKVQELGKYVERKIGLHKQFNVKVTPLSESLYNVFIQRTMGIEQVQAEVFIDTGYNGVWIIITEAESYLVRRVVEALCKKLYPLISMFYLNYSEMLFLTKTMEKSSEGQVDLTYLTLKRLKENDNGTEVLWATRVDKEIKRLQFDGYSVKVDHLEFKLRDKVGALLRAQLSRKGLCELKYGSFSLFYENVVFNAIEYGLKQKKFYSQRETSIEDGNIQVYPLKIDYDFSIHQEQMSQFVKKIVSGYSCSVIHSGNPYFAADLCDYGDGSSFGVAILGNSVTLTPIAKANAPAVWKLTGEIQEIFGDGQVRDITVA